MGSPTTKQVRPARSGHAAMRLESNGAGGGWCPGTRRPAGGGSVGDSQRGVGGQAVFASQHALGDLRDLDEVHPAGLGKGDLQLARRLAQQREAGAHDLPVLFGVAGRGQSADGGERGFKAGNSGQSGDQIEDAGLFALAVGREAQALIDLFAESCHRR